MVGVSDGPVSLTPPEPSPVPVIGGAHAGDKVPYRRGTGREPGGTG